VNFIGGARAWSELRKSFQEASNAGVVTVTAGGIEVINSGSMQVAVGDVLFVNVYVKMTKGGTAGHSDLTTGQSIGTGAVKFIGAFVNAFEEFDPQPINAIWSLVRTYMFIVTTAGTLTMQVFGSSAGSDGTVQIGNGRISVTVIRGS